MGLGAGEDSVESRGYEKNNFSAVQVTGAT